MAQRTPAQLLAQINSLIDTGGTPRISAADLRSVLTDIRDSLATWAWRTGATGTIDEALIPGGIARDSEVAALINQAVASLRGGVDAAHDTLAELAAAIAAIVPGATWSTGTASPSGGADGDWYVRQGATAPGIYYRVGGSWGLILAPGTGGGGGITLDQARDAAGELLATLAAFGYDAATNALTFSGATIEEVQDNLGGSSGDGTDGFLRSGSGISMVYDDSGNILTISATAVAPTMHDAFIGWSADTAFTEAEFQAGTEISSGSSGAIPTQSGFAYLGLWLAGTGWSRVTQVDIDHGPNGLSDLADPVALTIDGTAGQYRRYSTRQAGSVVSGGTLRWR